MSFTAEQLTAGIQLAYTFYNEGRLEDARVLVEGLLAMDPQNAYLHLMLGSTYQEQKRMDDAIMEYSRTIEFFPGDVSAWAKRGEAYLLQGKLQEAASDLNQAIRLDSGKNDPSAARAWFLLKMTSAALHVAATEGLEAFNHANSEIELQIGQIEGEIASRRES